MCAEVCPYGAIVYVEEDRQGLHKKRSGAERFLAALESVTGKRGTDRNPGKPK
jgi:hypothetical protein